MDRSGDEILTHAAFPANEDRRISVSDFLDDPADCPHPGAFAEQGGSVGAMTFSDVPCCQRPLRGGNSTGTHRGAFLSVVEACSSRPGPRRVDALPRPGQGQRQPALRGGGAGGGSIGPPNKRPAPPTCTRGARPTVESGRTASRLRRALDRP